MNLLEQYFSYPAAPERILSTIGIELHWILLQYTLGLPFAILVLLLLYKKTGNQNWLKLARTAIKALGLNFALGAASLSTALITASLTSGSETRGSASLLLARASASKSLTTSSAVRGCTPPRWRDFAYVLYAFPAAAEVPAATADACRAS